MKSLLNIQLFIGLTLVVGATIAIVNVNSTGCTSGFWGSGSCGTEAIISSIAIFFLGFYVLVLSVKNIMTARNEPENTNKSETLICPKCEKVIAQDLNENKLICPDCHIEMVQLDGFYNKQK